MTKIFLSVGATYTVEQEAFVTAFETFLSQNGCERLTVGRGSHFANQPVVSARDLMEKVDGVVVIAFTRTIIEKGIEKPGGPKPITIQNLRYPTIWNQLEAAMAFGLKLPLLVILEDGLHEEAMLKDRLEFRALKTALDINFFKSDEFKGIFADWTRIARERTHAKSQTIDPSTLTVRQIFGSLKTADLWKITVAFVSILAAIASGAYWTGKNLPANSTPIKLPIVQSSKNP